MMGAPTRYPVKPPNAGPQREWRTPPELFEPLNREFGFTLDPCAPDGRLCTRFFTEAEDGLRQDWSHDRVFMNPPYGREIYAWTRKARSEANRGALVVGLLPVKTETAWWHEDVLAPRAEVRYLRGRVRFLADAPSAWDRPRFASAIVIWRPPLPPLP